MPVNRTPRNYCTRIAFFLILAGLSLGIAHAASTGTTTPLGLLRQWGSAAPAQYGDYITATGPGLGTTHRYYIEVPSGVSQLVIDIFDPDCGNNAHDYRIGSTGTTATFTLNNPSGTAVRTRTSGQSWAVNNTWCNFDTIATPANGHWELIISTRAGGDDMNGYGIRAHDGTSGSGGTELNIYADSYISGGWVGTGSSTSTRFPYITAGCSFGWNDWDGDSLSTHTLRGRTGQIYLYAAAGSANNVWLRTAVSNYDSDLVNNNTGVWTWVGVYTDTAAPSGAGNYGILYASDYNAPGIPPTSQPDANNFRIYLPTDGSGAPSKPVVTQKLSYVSGPNPPANGQTTRVRVEIVVNNPAAQAITFSSSNLVTANIPGSGVVYAGNPLASQGSVTAEPTVGGTGTISWNPGTVAAGTTATFYYEVNVTPTSAGQRLPITGSQTTNGTTARFVDTTGNTTQTRATFTYGPLCGLAVTEEGPEIPTWAAITRFGSCSDSGQPTVEWQTGTESGTVGYNLWRKDRETGEYEQVNPMLLPALANAPQGGAYRLADPGAFSYEPVTYKLEEIDAEGRSLMHGPFTVAFGGGSGQDGLDREPRLAQEEPSDIYGFQRFARAKSFYEEARLNARRQELSRATLQAGSARERARVTVKGRGLFYVTAGQVATTLGVSESLAASLINGHNLKLTTLGRDVAWLADNSGAGLFFFNDGRETQYSDKNVFYIERGSGLAMDTVSGGNAGPAPDGQTYAETLRFTAGKYFLPSQDKDRLADDWMWEVVAAGSAGKTFALDVSGVAGSGQAKLRVVLRGATDTDAANDHHALVKVNGTEVGSGYWDGGKDHALELTFSASQLADGANTVEVSGALDMGAPYSIFYVDAIEVSYARRYRARSR